MHEACTTGVDGAGEEGHADGTLMGDALKSADQVCPLQVLFPRQIWDKIAADAGHDLTFDSCVH